MARAADETELDPAKVSDSLKAIFQFGSVATKQALNQNTVTVISGNPNGTYLGATFLLSGLAVAAVLARRGRPVGWFHLLWLGLFFAGGLFAIRNALWWSLAAPPAVAAILIEGQEERPGRRADTWWTGL